MLRILLAANLSEKDNHLLGSLGCGGGEEEFLLADYQYLQTADLRFFLAELKSHCRKDVGHLTTHLSELYCGQLLLEFSGPTKSNRLLLELCIGSEKLS